MSTVAIPLPIALREGDRLPAGEFLSRWEALPDLRHAELIDGIVFMPSPVSRTHATLHMSLGAWLWLYSDATPGCEALSEGTWVMGRDDVPQPDLALRIRPSHGGQSGDSGTYAAGAPELIVEITGSSSSRDLGIKLELYQRIGVREYITVLLKPRRIIWRKLVGGRYGELQSNEDGLLRSEVFPGLWLDPEAVFDPARSIRTAVEQGLQSAEHAEFACKLVVHKPR
jgi:Uma2 family endonuclease